jgi:hypothetical protein
MTDSDFVNNPKKSNNSGETGTSKTGNKPPQAPLALRVGVTGHKLSNLDYLTGIKKRSDPDIQAIHKTVKEVLQIISNSFKGIADTNSDLFDLKTSEVTRFGGGILRIISSLASGSDQWTSDEALNLGYELQVVLPYDRNEYSKDFILQNELDTYNRLCNVATAILELDGKAAEIKGDKRIPDSHNYEVSGRALLNQTDLLVAVWDGQPAHGPGGTGQIVLEALQCGIPVIWIPWDSPGKWQLYNASWRLLVDPDDIKSDNERLSEIISKLLLPPVENSQAGIESGKSLRKEYFEENQKKGYLQLGIWQLFRNIICGSIFRKGGIKKTLIAFHVKDFEASEKEDTLNQWNRKAGKLRIEKPLDSNILQWMNDHYAKHYAWANGLSIYYGNMHRSAFVVNYLLGALAVFLALVCIAEEIKGMGQSGWIIAELAVIIGILGLTYRGRRKNWHQRWIDYRMLAERLRIARYLALFGGGSPQVVYNAHLTTYGNPASTWMNWHYRAIERAAGVIPVSFSADYLSSCQELWRKSLIQDQVEYHKELFSVFSKMDRRLHKTGEWLFIATLIACIFHLGHLWLEEDPQFSWIPGSLSGWMTLLCAFLPALGAAFSAIRSHSEVQRLAQRSKAMEETLSHMMYDFARLPVTGHSLNSVQLRDSADRVSNLMTNEMLDWRVVFQDRPLGLPA